MSSNGLVRPMLAGEIVEASTTELLAQACELDAAPPFGAFVETTCDDGRGGECTIRRVHPSASAI